MQTSNHEREKEDAKSAQSVASPVRWWRSWWRSLSPTRQDRYAALAPLASVLQAQASDAREETKRGLIEQALSASNGSIKDVMDALAIPRKTLSDKMRKYGL